MDDVRHMIREMVEISFCRDGLFSMSSFCVWRRGMERFTYEKETVNEGEGEKTLPQERKVLKTSRTFLFYTWASGHYQQSQRREKPNHTKSVDNEIHFRQRKLSTYQVVDNAVMTCLEMDTTHPVCMTLILILPNLPQEELLYKVIRAGSEFRLLFSVFQKNIAEMLSILIRS